MPAGSQAGCGSSAAAAPQGKKEKEETLPGSAAAPVGRHLAHAYTTAIAPSGEDAGEPGGGQGRNEAVPTAVRPVEATEGCRACCPGASPDRGAGEGSQGRCGPVVNGAEGDTRGATYFHARLGFFYSFASKHLINRSRFTKKCISPNKSGLGSPRQGNRVIPPALRSDPWRGTTTGTASCWSAGRPHPPAPPPPPAPLPTKRNASRLVR